MPVDPGVLLSPPLSCTTTNLSRLNLSLVCLGWIRCCTPLPPLSLWTSSTLSSLHQLFCTTSISDRLDSSLVCLGWIRCYTPLPPLSPLCAHGPQVCRCHHPTHSAQPSNSSRLDPLLVRLSWICCCTLILPLRAHEHQVPRCCRCVCWRCAFVPLTSCLLEILRGGTCLPCII